MRAALCCLAFLVPVLGKGHTLEEASAGLEVIVLPTIQYAHEDIWTKTPGERGPAFTGVGQVVRSRAVHILVSATRWTIGADQNAEMSYDVAFIRPDGKTSGRPRGSILRPRLRSSLAPIQPAPPEALEAGTNADFTLATR